MQPQTSIPSPPHPVHFSPAAPPLSPPPLRPPEQTGRPSKTDRQPGGSRLSLICLSLTTLLMIAVAPSLASIATDRHGAKAAVSGPFSPNNKQSAIWFSGWGEGGFVFEAPGTFVEYEDGTAELLGTVVDLEPTGGAFEVMLRFAGRTDIPPEGSPKLELAPGAYISGGGPVDPGAWHYYQDLSGQLLGRQAWEGAVVDILPRGEAFQVGVGANGKNVFLGGSSWITYDVLQGPDVGALPFDRAWGDINLELDPERCAERSEAGLFAVQPGGRALWMPGLGEDFVFETPGTFTESTDGTGQLAAIARRESDPSQAFEVVFTFKERVSEPLPGSPKLELLPIAYVDDGGPIDPATWWYYSGFEGKLTGIDAFEGAEIELLPSGPAFQVGVGANGRNEHFGASTWFLWTVLQQPALASLQVTGQGDLTVDLSTCQAICVEKAATDPDYKPLLSGRALYLDGLGVFQFTEGARLVEMGDGRARLRARLAHRLDASKILNLDLELSGRQAEAPAGSPKLRLPAMAYQEGGGPVDPGLWHYYPEMRGTLQGEGSLSGAEMELSPRGGAFQVGPGANGRNLLHGLGGWLDFVLTAQPPGLALPLRGTGDLTVSQCPTTREPDLPAAGSFEPAALRTVQAAGEAGESRGCHPGIWVDYKAGEAGDGGRPQATRRRPEHALGAPDPNAPSFVSLGFGGSLMVAFAEPIWNGPGPDLALLEHSPSTACEHYPEQARVLASQDGERWVSLGTVCQDGELDLGPLPWATQLRIEDVSERGAFFAGRPADGFDVEAITAYRCGR